MDISSSNCNSALTPFVGSTIDVGSGGLTATSEIDEDKFVRLQMSRPNIDSNISYTMMRLAAKPTANASVMVSVKSDHDTVTKDLHDADEKFYDSEKSASPLETPSQSMASNFAAERFLRRQAKVTDIHKTARTCRQPLEMSAIQHLFCCSRGPVSLEVLLEQGLRLEEVPAQLKLYRRIRKNEDQLRRLPRDRKHTIIARIKSLQAPADYDLDHDVHRDSIRRRERQRSRAPDRHSGMCVCLGSLPGPHQSRTDTTRRDRSPTYTNASIMIKTSRKVLQKLLPSEKTWRFTSPDSFAYCTFTTTTLYGGNQSDGGPHNHLGLYIHGVEYEDKGEKVKGSFLPVLFDGLIGPSTSCKEEFTVPKIFSHLDVKHDHTLYHIRASQRGLTWGDLQLEGLQEIDRSTFHDLPGSIPSTCESTDRNEGIIFRRRVPQASAGNVRPPGSNYSIFIRSAEDIPKPTITRVWTASRATIMFNPRDWASFPGLHHIVGRLAQIPVHEVVRAKVVEGRGISDAQRARMVGSE